MKVFVIMKQRYSPIAISSAHPHEVFSSRKEAVERVKELEKKAQSNNYWIESANMAVENKQEVLL